ESAVDQSSSSTPPPSQPSTPHSSTPPASSSSALPGATTCPGTTTCVLTGDVGNAIAAINAYRTQHGQPAVSGAVSPAAQTCALNNGNGCTGGWAETEVPAPDGPAAVQKILQFAKLLDPGLKNFGVGWAYDPGAKLYYFAIIRND
ncbi:MAG: hypothetical protein J0H43_08730, partial [Actinobacteria bacterium]|nr:hypothetical protein [Actinomycetota bacterium]